MEYPQLGPKGGSQIGSIPNGGSPSPIELTPNVVNPIGGNPTGGIFSIVFSPIGVSPIDPSDQMRVIQLGVVQTKQTK